MRSLLCLLEGLDEPLEPIIEPLARARGAREDRPLSPVQERLQLENLCEIENCISSYTRVGGEEKRKEKKEENNHAVDCTLLF